MTLTIQEVFEQASGCGDHPLTITAAEINGAETILALGGCGCRGLSPNYDTCGSYCDTESFAVAKLPDGRYVVIHESSDTTGHGCRCSGGDSTHATLSDALWHGLGREDREMALKYLDATDVKAREIRGLLLNA